MSIGPIDGLAIETEFDLPRVTVALRGELDLAGAPSLEREIEALPWPQLAELTFDLKDTTFLDSTGLSVLIRASKRAVAAGLRFSLVRVSPQPLKLLKLAGMIDRLNVEPGSSQGG
jgi:anti-sigma B factor antagonist